MPDHIDTLIRQTLNAIGDHRNEKIVVPYFGRRYAMAHRQRVVRRCIKWLSLGSLGVVPFWWPEDWALGDGAISLFEALQRLFATPSFIESAFNTMRSLLA